MNAQASGASRPVPAVTVSMSVKPSSSTMDYALSSTMSRRFVRGAVKFLMRPMASSSPVMVGAFTR